MAKNKIVTTYMGVNYPHTKAGKAKLKEEHPDVYASVFIEDVEEPVEPEEGEEVIEEEVVEEIEEESEK